MEGSIFANFEKQMHSAMIHIRSGNELLFIDCDLTKCLFWQFQENIRDMLKECAGFASQTSTDRRLETAQSHLNELLSDAMATFSIDVRDLSAEHMEQYVIAALQRLEDIEIIFMNLTGVVSNEYGFEKFRKATGRN
ncbi:hypothetical protein ACQ895_01470 [Vibrio parahaemolyticus]|uniref:hypothetical protein n=1 Tax=Vibrio parahaemolyticus TaxID=670 RepID=UPI00387ABEA0